MKLNVNANRMTLLKLKERLKLAQKGHKLLKDKQDELMRQFMQLIDSLKDLRKNVETDYLDALRRFTAASGHLPNIKLIELFALPSIKLHLNVGETRVMNIHVPTYEPEFEGELACYGYLNSTGEMDSSLEELQTVLQGLLHLAATEKKAQLLAEEIDKTRRRVNALEYILIPDLRETIKYISLKLEEMERENLTRLMKVKEMLENKPT